MKNKIDIFVALFRTFLENNRKREAFLYLNFNNRNNTKT